MRLLARSAALVLTALLARPVAAAPRALDGEVVSAAGEALVGADVVLLDAGGAVVARATTDALGRWHLLADGAVVVQVVVAGLPAASTPIGLGGHVRTALGTPTRADLELEATEEKPIEASAIDAQPTHTMVDPTLMTKLPGTRGDPFAAAASLPSMGRPPALSTIYIVRGASPDESATYLDGAPIGHAFHFGGLVAVVPGALIGNVAVVPGGFGVAYGRATAGLVDVELAPLRADRAHVVGNLDAIDVGAVGSTPLGESTRVAIGARRSHVDAWLGKVLGGTVTGELPRYLDGQVIVEHDLSRRARVRVGLIAADDNVSVTDPNSDPQKPRTGSWASSMVRAHARLDARVGERCSVLGVVAASRARDAIVGELDQFEDVRKTLFARLEASSDVGDDARATVGVDGLLTRIDGVRILQVPVGGFGGSAVFPLRGSIGVDRAEPAAYAQLVLRPARPVTVTPGVRVDRHYLGELLVQPRVALRVQAADATVLKAVAGVYARPNVYDAISARDEAGTLLPVIVDAGPARGVNVGVGLEQGLGAGVELAIDLYARTAQHVLVPVQQPARPIYDPNRHRPYPNADFDTGGLAGYEYPLWGESGRTRATGAELLLKWHQRDVAAFVGYALGRSELRETPFSPWRRAPFDQTHVLNAAIVGKLGLGWEAGARFRLAVGVLDSPYPQTDIAPKNDPDLDPNRPLTELGPIHSLDLRVEKGWKVGPAEAGGQLAVYVEIRNVYNRRAREPLAYNYVYGYPVVGQGLPIIPNLGVRGSL